MKRTLVFLFSLLSFQLYSQTPCACCDISRMQFDFWLGDWTVVDTTGKEVGENTITKQEKGCILQEKWKGASGGTGTSTNYFDVSDSTWNQLWIDNTGSVLKLKGNLQNGVMVLKSDIHQGQNSEYYNQISWTPNEDGTVRQLWEVFDKNGKLLNILFDGVYHKKIIDAATITCPACGYEKLEKLPTDVCKIKYTCEHCSTTFGPKDGDCCVFCSYSEHKCPSKQ